MKIKPTITAGLASIGLVVGLAGFAGASTGTNSYTGPDSWNKVRNKTSARMDVDNNNHVSATNNNNQNAHTGSANVSGNTTGDDAWSGNAENANSLSASLTVNNAAGGGIDMPAAPAHSGTNNMTGPDSHNYVENSTYTSVEIDNDNCLTVTNTNNQTATSGTANVSGNTTGGAAISGDASNTNATTVNFAVTN
jgi:hypothetical protein